MIGHICRVTSSIQKLIQQQEILLGATRDASRPDYTNFVLLFFSFSSKQRMREHPIEGLLIKRKPRSRLTSNGGWGLLSMVHGDFLFWESFTRVFYRSTLWLIPMYDLKLAWIQGQSIHCATPSERCKRIIWFDQLVFTYKKPFKTPWWSNMPTSDVHYDNFSPLSLHYP